MNIKSYIFNVVYRWRIKINPFSVKKKRPALSRYMRYSRDVLKNKNFEIGEYTYGSPIIATFIGSKLKVGSFSIFSPGVVIDLAGNHRTNFVTTYPFHRFVDDWPEAGGLDLTAVPKGDVIIGNDVWIGYGAMILSGVTVGDGASIGARAVVTKDVEPYSIVAGNPARLVRKRFDEETIRRLLEIRWWDWPVEKIKQNLEIIGSSNISRMLELE